MTSPIQALPAELLEHILWLLPMKDLLLAQRVCLYWQSIIAGSSKLQINLFRKLQQPDFCLRVTYRATRTIQNWVEKFTWGVVPATVQDKQGLVRDDFGCMKTVKFTEDRFPIAIVNDVFFDLEGKFATEDFWKRESNNGDECITMVLNRRLLLAMNSGTKSWRTTFITQPPAKSISCHFHFNKEHSWRRDGGHGRLNRQHDELWIESELESEQGVTVGQLADEIQRLETENEAKVELDSIVRALETAWVSESNRKLIEERDDNSDDGADLIGVRRCEHAWDEEYF